MTNFKDKNIAILGFGMEGQSTAEYLLVQGAMITIFDEKKRDEFDKKTLELFEERNVEFKFGPFEDLSMFYRIVRSPGIPFSHPSLVKAQEKGIPITSETKLFFDLCPSQIIGVTGTKGKGTTSTLIYEMLKKQGFDAYLGGNIGIPPLTFLDKLTKDSWVVLELSSFQLEDMEKSPHIAVMLMVTSEHLSADSMGTQNYHASLEEYIAAKRNIVRFQKPHDFAILNRDFPASNESDIHTEGKVYQVSRGQDVLEGCFVRDGTVWTRIDGIEDEIIETNDILLPGRHNLENVCAAVMAAILAGVDPKNCIPVLKSFKGLEHRLELVATVNGVRYYDDSFSTTPETAEAAIEAFDAPEILILGGSKKNSDFTELGKVISEKENIKAIIGIGVEWKRIKSGIRNQESGIRIIEDAKTMKEIVEKAAEIATLGDVVLLSPACASFDMFKNYKERGKQFKQEILALRETSLN